MKNFVTKKELVISILLILAILAYVNPFKFYMLSMSGMVILGILVILVGLFAGIIIHEKVVDEREITHRNTAGRFGYTVGIIMLMSAILVQAFTLTTVDPWLSITLLVMVLAKIGARMYNRIKY
jgi:hypothetical protein